MNKGKKLVTIYNFNPTIKYQLQCSKNSIINYLKIKILWKNKWVHMMKNTYTNKQTIANYFDKIILYKMLLKSNHL